MDDVCWFLIAALASLGGWLAGRRAGVASDGVTRAAAAAGVALLLAWTWLLRHPSVGLELVPVSVLARLEGVGGLPMFGLILGLCWERAHLPRQRAVVGWAVALGLIYFVNGGGWLLQRTPEAAFASTLSPAGSSGVVLQSQDFSCVPAATATLLNRWGHPTSESAMARLTRTRVGSGSTTLRALEGLSERLATTDLRPFLLEVEAADLTSLPLPLLTPLQYEARQQHMVVVERVRGDACLVLDPMEGSLWMTTEAFQSLFTGRVIVLERRR